MLNLDKYFTKYTELLADVKPRLSKLITEEDSKLQLIARVFTEALGWGFSDIAAERQNDNGFSDYAVMDNGRAVFLVEAKRIGKLEIATQATTRQFYKISGPALKKCIGAIEQAALYCAPDGIQLAVVTDGVTWIIFKPWVPNESYKSKEAVVFPDLDSIAGEYAEFFDLLSKEACQKRKYKAIFDKIHGNRVLITQGLYPAFSDGDIHPVAKTQLAFDLDHVFSTFFAELTGDIDPNMIIECFVETKESRIADFALEKLTTYVLGNISPPEKDVNESLQQLITSTMSDRQGETVFVVGPSGAGKSTFLRRFFQTTLPRGIRERCVVINVNSLDATGDEAAQLAWLTNHAISSIEGQLYSDGFPSQNQLLGLYHLEYKRRSSSTDAELYRQNPDAFRLKFSDWMSQQVEHDREGYLRRLLTDIVNNRKYLPIFVVDNTDEFSLQFKQSVFQYYQALRRHAGHCLLIFPVTDKSAWSFSKTEIFNIYSSRSFFLPTPSPKEIFRKRVEFLRNKIRPNRKTVAHYDAGISLRVELKNLEAFATAIEDFFVNPDFASYMLGTLANYNIRNTLLLARRIMTSAVLNVEDLVKSYISGTAQSLPPEKFIRALILGDFNFYKKGDAHLLYPIFDVRSDVPQSPLINVRILALLKAAHDRRTSDDSRYLEIDSLTQYFDGIGYTETAVEGSLLALAEAMLIERHDPSISSLSLA